MCIVVGLLVNRVSQPNTGVSDLFGIGFCLACCCYSETQEHFLFLFLLNTVYLTIILSTRTLSIR